MATPFKPYRLSPLDHLIPPIYMTVFTSFALKDTTSGTSALAKGVHRLIQNLPFLAGNAVFTNTSTNRNVLQVRPGNRQFMADYPMLHKKVHPQGISYIQNPAIFSNDFSALPLEISRHDTYPLIRFQANVMRDGIILATTLFHPAMDGAGCFNVLQSLAAHCRSVEHSAPITSPQEQEDIRERIRSVKHSTTGLSNNEAYGAHFNLNTPSISRKLLFSNDKLEHLRDLCQNSHDRGLDHASVRTRISLNDVASAMIWLCVVRARGKVNGALSTTSTSRSSSMVTTINARSIVDSLIPDKYLGNAIVFGATTYPRSPMLEEESSLFALVKDLVFRVHKARKAVDGKQVKATIAHVNSSHDWASFTLKPPEMAFSNLRYTKLYELDFGSSLGNIERFELPDPRIAGGCWILPARTIKEGPSSPWELSLALEEDAWVHLEADPLIRWVTEREGVPGSKV